MYEHNQPDGTKRMRGNFLLSSAFYYISLFEEENNGGMCQLLYHSSVLFFNPGILGKINLTPMSIARKTNTTVCDCQFVLIELTSKMSFWSWILYALKLIMYCSQWNCFSWSSVPNCEQIALYCTDPNIFQTCACYSNRQSCHIPPIFEPKKKWFFKYSCMYWASGFLLAVSFLCKCLSLRLPKYQSYNCTYLIQYISSIGFTHVLVAMPRVCLNILKELMGS